MINKQPKISTCVCGVRFKKYKIEQYHPYCTPQCKLKHVTGKIDNDENLIDLPLQRLKDIAKGTFCDFIKLRDKNLPEITSGVMEKKGDRMDAGHLFDCNQCPGLMFDEDNCFKQSEFYNLQMMDEDIFRQTSNNVRARIGASRFQSLVDKAQSTFLRNYKYSKLEYIDYYKIYKQKIEELKK